MYLSKVFIEWQWAKDTYQLHKALWLLFPAQPEAERHFLFRVERLQAGRGAELLLLSASNPVSCSAAQVMVSKPHHIVIPEATPLRFRLRANPVKTIKDARERRNGKGEVKSCRVPLIAEEQQRQWLERKLGGMAELHVVQVTPERPLYFRKQDKPSRQSMAGKIQPVLFEGVLTIQDAPKFSDLLVQGVGPAKSLGCGLLSLARA